MFTLVDEALEHQLSRARERRYWLLLDKHPDFPGHWIVEGFTYDYLVDLKDIIGSYRALAPSGLKAFMEAASEHGYRVAFFDDPTDILKEYESLNKVPDVEVTSTFPNTVKGMLPFQVQGFNFLKDKEFGVSRWDTGTGKTILAAALIKHHLMAQDFDYCFFVVKSHNKFNTARKLLDHAGLDSIVIDGDRNKRWGAYRMALYNLGFNRVEDRLEPVPAIVVMNYEQFKNDFVEWKQNDEGNKRLDGLSKFGTQFFEGTRVLIVWDEMPTKLKTRTTQIYKAICHCLYRTAAPQVKHEKLRPKSMRSYMLSATPIENSPEDYFNCVRLLDGGQTYGTVTNFNNEYVASWNYYDPSKPQSFHNLEKMRLKSAGFVHQVNKSDPDIAAIFPRVIEEPVYIDWDDHNGKLYEDIQDYATELADSEEFEDLPIFALLGALQMVCDAPEMVLDSAALREASMDDLYDFELTELLPTKFGGPPSGSAVALALKERFGNRFKNEGHPKIDKLKELLTVDHLDSKVVLFTRWNDAIMPYMERYLKDWGVSYARYHGTPKQKQTAQDAFQEGDARVFLSSDSGSDSIDLDAGNVVIDYDLPWKWTTLTQRHNRVHRASSTHPTVYYYSLMMADSMEQRVLSVITKKKGYHNQLFDPKAGDYSASARLSKEDLLYALTGR